VLVRRVPSKTEMVSPSYNQVDIPHVVDWVLRYRFGPSVNYELSLPPFYADKKDVTVEETASSVTYTFNKASSLGDIYVEAAKVYKPDFSFQSGSHKVLFWAVYKGEKFVLSIEEIEFPYIDCAWIGERVEVAAETDAGYRLLNLGGEDALLDIVKGAFYYTTGVYLYSRQPARFFERFTYYVHRDPESILAKGKWLSAEADACWVTDFAWGFRSIIEDYSSR